MITIQGSEENLNLFVITMNRLTNNKLFASEPKIEKGQLKFETTSTALDSIASDQLIEAACHKFDLAIINDHKKRPVKKKSTYTYNIEAIDFGEALEKATAQTVSTIEFIPID